MRRGGLRQPASAAGPVRGLAALLAALVALAAASAVAAEASGGGTPWPQLQLPGGSGAYELVPAMIYNGFPARVLRFEAPGDEAQVRAALRSQLGPQVVESRVKGDPVLSTRRDGFMITVQLHPLPGGQQQGTVMVSDLRAPRVSSPVATDTRSLLPPDSQLMSTLQSDDAGKRSLMLTALNTVGVQANRDHLVQGLQQRGFHVVSEFQPQPGREDRLMVMLASATEEAQLTIADVGRFRRVTVNRVKEIK